jgi:MFS family permease
MKDKSLLFLAATSALFFLASSLTGIFLPSYYIEMGLSINQIIVIIGIMLIVLGTVPILTLKLFPKHFEKLLMVGLALNAMFFLMLIFVKNPIILGLTYGLSVATFWPAFNLLMLRFTKIKHRGLIASVLYVVAPTLAGIIGPLLGGVLIHFLNFKMLFIVGAVFSATAMIFASRINYKPLQTGFILPKHRLLILFAVIAAFMGLTNIGWIAYPLFLKSLTGNFLWMGAVATSLSIIFAIIAIVTGKISENEKHRINFGVFGALMACAWLIALSTINTVPQLMIISVFSGLAGVFWIALFSVYGDFFERKYHATLIVLWETFLMIGRLSNLVLVFIFINNFNFSGYFCTIGLISLLGIIPYAILQFLFYKRIIKIDAKQE